MSVMVLEKEFYIHTSFVDENDYLRPAAIWDLFQDMAGMHADILGCGFETMIKDNLIWVTAYQEFEVVSRLPKYNEKVLIRTYPEPKNRLEFIREYQMLDLDGNLLVKAISSWYCVDFISRRVVRGDNVIFNGEYYENLNYPGFTRRKLNLDIKKATYDFEYKTVYSDLDHNGHVNNAKYLDIIYNEHINLNDKKIYKGQIAYMKEIKLHDLIHVYYYNEDGYDCYIGTVNDEIMFEMRLELK